MGKYGTREKFGDNKIVGHYLGLPEKTLVNFILNYYSIFL